MKRIILSIVIIIIGFFGFIVWGLYLMEIEDHYGDLQQTYFDSQSGDIIVNNQTKKIGIISKNWKRVNVITKENDTLGLYDLIYVNKKENNYEVLRSENELNIKELSYKKYWN